MSNLTLHCYKTIPSDDKTDLVQDYSLKPPDLTMPNSILNL